MKWLGFMLWLIGAATVVGAIVELFGPKLGAWFSLLGGVVTAAMGVALIDESKR